MSKRLLSPEYYRKALTELAHRTQMKEYQRDPQKWYVERFGGREKDIDWSLWGGYEEHQWDGTPNPFKKALESLAGWKSVAIESGTSTGKTFIAAKAVYWFLDVFENSLVVTTAPKQQQLKSVLWSEIARGFAQFKNIRPNADMFSLRILPDGSKVRFGKGKLILEDDLGDMHQAIGVVSGVRADEESATKMQGYHRKYMLFVVEECAGVPHPVLTAIKNTCTGDNNVILGIGNPDSVTDALHQFSELEHVESIRISAFDHPNVVLGKSVIDGAVTQGSIDKRRHEYGETSNLYLSRVRGIAPKQGIDSLIMFEWIVSCCVGRTEYDQAGEIPDDEWASNAVGIDVANSENGDAAALAWGRKNELTELQEFQCPNANHLAHNLIKDDFQLSAGGYQVYGTSKVEDYNIAAHNMGVDAVGVGVATVNEFVHEGFDVIGLQGAYDDECVPLDNEGKPLYVFRSLRGQMYFQARLDLQNRRVRIALLDKTIERKLIKELTIVRYKTSDGAILIESKETIKKRIGGKSPNLADAFVYWNWVRNDRKMNSGPKPMGSVNQYAHGPVSQELEDWKKSTEGFS